ncbi:MAG: hypothetical protein J5588_06270 [Bacteroidales bacterium]|nr:hypothetical protein [Bacteroidales bacterium]
MKIAVDFDGTLVEHKYPEIGAKKLFAFETLRELQKRGDFLILWTYRSGKLLDEAVEFCRKNGVEFYAVNKNYPEEEFDETQMSRKIDADVYIDDRNVEFLGEIDWSEICKKLKVGTMNETDYATPKKKSFLGSLFGK